MPLPFPHPSFGSPFIELQTIDSTNKHAMGLINAGLASPGTAVFAHEQIAGKGQRGRVWDTEKGKNLILSVIIQPGALGTTPGQGAPSPATLFPLSASVALGATDFLENFTRGDLSIKWPNDLYWRDRKAGGILIENVIRPGQGWTWSVVGIGININQTEFSADLPNPVSLKQITGRELDPVSLAKDLCDKLFIRYQQLQSLGADRIMEEYNACLYKKGQLVKLRKENRVFEAKVIGVNKFGQMEIEHGVLERVEFGEVSWVL